MLVFPAIDLRRGRCVRLLQGDPAQETVFSENPAAVAAHWADEGAAWLHVVNLDAALGEGRASWDAARGIAEASAARGVSVQVGGGLRTVEDVAEALGWGVARVILGTVALRAPAMVEQCLTRFGAERIVVALDARDGRVAIEGWQQTSDLSALEVAGSMKALGISRLLYTDIQRDGTHAGPNIAKTGELAQKSGLRVLASGGVGTLDHLRQVRWIEPYGVEGVIVGRALYEGRFTLREAMAAVGG